MTAATINRVDEGSRGPAVREPVVAVHELRMRYGKVDAVRGIDLEVRRGEVFAFFGPNGAGKTTTVEILEGFRRRTGGDVRVLGADPGSAGAEWRARVGVVLQESQPEATLRVGECLALYAGYYAAPRDVDDTLKLVGLAEHRSQYCKSLSGGQKRRLDLAVALIGDPELLFLDEPTTGFDPIARRAAWDMVAGLRDLGKTIFLTTHYMEEAEFLADRIAVIASGQIVAEGTPQSLGGRDSAPAIITFTLPASITIDDLPSNLKPFAGDNASGERVEISTQHALPLLASITSWALATEIDLPDLQVKRPSLEDMYLQLTDGGSR